MVNDDRYKHSHPTQGTRAYEQGKAQAQCALERYHYLRAAVLGKYVNMDGIAPDISRGQLFARQGLDFGSYEDYPLKPITGIKLHPRQDGTVHPGDLEVYHDSFKFNWKHSEGGILNCIGDEREFFNTILNYHSRAGTTGNKEWDDLFTKLKADGFPKGSIPCMFFARDAGCLDGDCPFLHDATAARAARKRILERRREDMLKPTPRQIMNDTKKVADNYREARGLPKEARLPNSIVDLLRKPRARLYCSNPDCTFPWLATEPEDSPPLMACSRCKWTCYCSADCQRKDWPRHKKEPCAPLDEMVENDDLWSPIGTRKGTEMHNISWGDA